MLISGCRRQRFALVTPSVLLIRHAQTSGNPGCTYACGRLRRISTNEPATKSAAVPCSRSTDNWCSSLPGCSSSSASRNCTNSAAAISSPRFRATAEPACACVRHAIGTGMDAAIRFNTSCVSSLEPSSIQIICLTQRPCSSTDPMARSTNRAAFKQGITTLTDDMLSFIDSTKAFAPHVYAAK